MSSQAIERIFSCYCRYIDDRRLDDVAALFAPDGVLSLEQFDVRACGPAEVRTKLDAITDERIKGTHASFNHLIDIDGDAATATADFMLVEFGGAPRIMTVGRYHARFVRAGASWKIGEWKIELRANAFDL